MTLDLFEFIRRFLLHILPARFYKIRYYGLLSNRYRQAKLELCQEILEVAGNETAVLASISAWEDLLLDLCGIDVRKCPKCQIGQMVRMTIDCRSAAAPS